MPILIDTWQLDFFVGHATGLSKLPGDSDAFGAQLLDFDVGEPCNCYECGIRARSPRFFGNKPNRLSGRMATLEQKSRHGS